MALATDKNYSSRQDIREEAGQQHLVKLETPSGSADGTNKTFYVGRSYIVDRDYDDKIDNNDVVVYDDNVAVDVDSVNPETGEVVLVSVPASSSTMLVTYAHSALSDTLVGKRRSEAIAWAKKKLAGILDYSTWTTEDVPYEVQTFTRMYAAALILIRDQGLNTDTENTSKDGYKKLSTAKKILMDFVEEAQNSSGSTARVSVSTKSDGNLFRRQDDLANWQDTEKTEEHFMRGD